MKVTTKFAGIDAGAPVAASARGTALHAVDFAAVVESAPRLPPAAAAGATSVATAVIGNRAWHAPTAENDGPPDTLLLRAEFLRMVQREKRRTDRSHSALSLVLLEIDGSANDRLHEVIDSVCAMVRETDYVATIDDECIAVLLPDTGEEGLRSFCDKVALTRLGRSTVVAGATYPGADFDRLIAERLGTPRSRHAVGAAEQPIAVTHGYALKRALDVLGALVALVVLSPLMLVVALAIKLTSPGPVIFRQHRVGQRGVPFTMYKFRSMRTDIDDVAHREFVASLIAGAAPPPATAQTGAFKMKADPRITTIGRFIRKTSIDELPQFFNVLVGNMSLVGPRPPVDYEAARYKSWHLRRVFEMKPGLTGIWQVEGRSRVTFDEMVRMDLRYLRKCSLRFDVGILLRTVVVVLKCEGAQ